MARYIAWLFATGFHQDLGIDYNETFSLVVKQSAIQVVLALTVNFNWPLHQLDVNTFLHGILHEIIGPVWHHFRFVLNFVLGLDYAEIGLFLDYTLQNLFGNIILRGFY